MLRNLNITARMTLLILAGAGAVLALIVWASGRHSRKLLEAELRGKAMATAQAAAGKIEGVQNSAARTAEELAVILEQGDRDPAKTYSLLKTTVARNPDVYGSAAAFEPGVVGPGDPGCSPYAWRQAGQVLAKDLAGRYDYAIQDWYAVPKELGRPVWSEPYFDEGGGGILMATYSVPLYEGGAGRRFIGVATCDVSLGWLSGMLTSLPLDQDGYAFLVSQHGTIIAHPTRQFIMNETFFSLAEERNDPALRALGQKMVRGESGFVPFVTLTTHTRSWLAFTPVSSTGWSLGVVFPRKAVDGKVWSLMLGQGILGAVGFALLWIVVLVIARSITRPIRTLAEATKILASGDLDAPLPSVPGSDEVARLSSDFASMQRDLKAHVEELKETTAKKERVERELQIAHTIQMSLVPRTFPPFIGRTDFEIFAVLDPARQIGGDLYDFRLLDDDHLLIVIGDVSGKGIPAALFMAVTRTLLRSMFLEHRETDAVVEHLNGELAQQGDTAMFVTLFAAVIDLLTGEVRYTNGGHCPPYVARAAGRVEAVPNVGGIIVGILPDQKYKSASVHLQPGDTLLFYTDGVTEATNLKGEFFGEERALLALEELGGASCEALVKGVRKRVGVFAEGAEQSDDITIMAFRWAGRR